MLWLLPMSWMRSPPKYTFKYCIPRQIPNTGICFFAANATSRPSSWSRSQSSVSQPQSSWPYQTGSTSPPPPKRRPSQRCSSATSGRYPPTGTPPAASTAFAYAGGLDGARESRIFGFRSMKSPRSCHPMHLGTRKTHQVFLVGLRNSNCLAEFRPQEVGIN